MGKKIATFSSQIGDGQIHILHMKPINDDLHRHVFFELVYVVAGSATHYLGDECAHLRAGDYFIIDTGSAHCYRDIKDFEIVNCMFLPEYIDRALCDCPSLSSMLSNQVLRFGLPFNVRTADRVFHDADGSVRRLFKVMEKEHSAKKTGYFELLRCYLTQVLVCAVRASEEAESKRREHSATAAAADYLCAHYKESLSLSSLSKAVGYTPQYLSAVFAKDTGMSLSTFLQRLRVEEACKLLSGTDMRLSDIAETVGYSDAKHFSRVFHKHKGFSPREFRAGVI